MEFYQSKKRFSKISYHKNIVKHQSLGLIMQNRQFDRMQKLQLSLNRDLHQNVPEPSVPMTNQLEIKVPKNRLYAFFLEKAKEVDGKLQQERINLHSQFMNNIIETVKQRQKTKKFKLAKLNKELQQMYENLHSLYEKMVISRQQPDEQRKMELKNKICSKQKQKDALDYELVALRDEKLVFLRLLLKNGFYRQNGVQWFFQRMIEQNYTPTHFDFPSFMDDHTIECLLLEFQNMKKIKNSKKFPTIQQSTKISNPTGFQRVATLKRVKSVYDETKNYVNQWLKKEGWRNRSLKHIQKEEVKQQKGKQWKQKEARRMKEAYDRETYRKVMRITFGITKYQKRKLKVVSSLSQRK